MAARRVVEFFFAPGSRYSYLAAGQLPALARETGFSVAWRPVHGPALRALRGADPFSGAPVSGQYEWPYREQDARRWARYYGIPYREPPSHDFDGALLARAATAGDLMDAAAAASWALMRAVYASDVWPLDERVCVDAVRSVGLDAGKFCAVLHDPATETALQAVAVEAHRRGAFGVPTFFVGDEMFWGNDRLPLLRHLLLRGS